jgi:hypothetical protein
VTGPHRSARTARLRRRRRRPLGRVGHVERKERDAIARFELDRLDAPTGGHDRVATLERRLGDRQSEAARSPGDQPDPVHVHVEYIMADSLRRLAAERL